MLRILVHIQNHLDEALHLEQLAAVAHFSPYHFHRVFRGMVGESVQGHIRRLRLERAAHRLRFTKTPITGIAFEAGYETHEAFTRSFRSRFDTSPSEFRKNRASIPAPDPSAQVPYSPDGSIQKWRGQEKEGYAMYVRTERVEPMKVFFVRHTGPYQEVGNAWTKLFGWAGSKGLVGPMTVAFGVAHDDPAVTPPDRIRYDACLKAASDEQPQGEIGVQTVGGGCFAVTGHIGPYENLGDTYARLCGEWLPDSGRELRSAPALEFYRNSPMNTPPEQLITDIYMPLEDE